MVCFLGHEAAIREAPAGVRTGASAAPASVSQGRNPVAPVPNQRGCCSEPSNWLPDKLRSGRGVPRRSPGQGPIPGEEMRRPRLPGWGALIPSHKNPPLVIRPKEEARKNRASLPEPCPCSRSAASVSLYRAVRTRLVEQIGSGPAKLSLCVRSYRTPQLWRDCDAGAS